MQTLDGFSPVVSQIDAVNTFAVPTMPRVIVLLGVGEFVGHLLQGLLALCSMSRSCADDDELVGEVDERDAEVSL